MNSTTRKKFNLSDDPTMAAVIEELKGRLVQVGPFQSANPSLFRSSAGCDLVCEGVKRAANKRWVSLRTVRTKRRKAILPNATDR